MGGLRDRTDVLKETESQRRALPYLTTPSQHTRAHTRAEGVHTQHAHLCTQPTRMHTHVHTQCMHMHTCTRKVGLFRWCPPLQGAQQGPEQPMGGRTLAPWGLRWDAQIRGQGDPACVDSISHTPRLHTPPLRPPGMLQALHSGLGVALPGGPSRPAWLPSSIGDPPPHVQARTHSGDGAARAQSATPLLDSRPPTVAPHVGS